MTRSVWDAHGGRGVNALRARPHGVNAPSALRHERFRSGPAVLEGERCERAATAGSPTADSVQVGVELDALGVASNRLDSAGDRIAAEEDVVLPAELGGLDHGIVFAGD